MQKPNIVIKNYIYNPEFYLLEHGKIKYSYKKQRNINNTHFKIFNIK